MHRASETLGGPQTPSAASAGVGGGGGKEGEESRPKRTPGSNAPQRAHSASRASPPRVRRGESRPERQQLPSTQAAGAGPADRRV